MALAYGIPELQLLKRLKKAKFDGYYKKKKLRLIPTYFFKVYKYLKDLGCFSSILNPDYFGNQMIGSKITAILPDG